LGPKCIWLQRARAPCSPIGCKSIFFLGSMAKPVLAPRPAPGGRGRRAHVSIRWLGIMHGLFRRRGRRPHSKTHTYPNGLADLAWQLPARSAFPICIYSPQARIVLSLKNAKLKRPRPQAPRPTDNAIQLFDFL
jgi:hypothetical protein